MTKNTQQLKHASKTYTPDKVRHEKNKSQNQESKKNEKSERERAKERKNATTRRDSNGGTDKINGRVQNEMCLRDTRYEIASVKIGNHVA